VLAEVLQHQICVRASFGNDDVIAAVAPLNEDSAAYIAASGGFVSIAVAIGMSVWRAREAKNAETFGSARWARPDEVRGAGLLGEDGVVLGKFDRAHGPLNWLARLCQRR